MYWYLKFVGKKGFEPLIYHFHMICFTEVTLTFYYSKLLNFQWELNPWPIACKAIALNLLSYGSEIERLEGIEPSP